MNHEQLITEIQDHIKENCGVLDLILDGLNHFRPFTSTVKIIASGIFTDYGSDVFEDFYSFDELPDSDLEQILTQIQLQV